MADFGLKSVVELGAASGEMCCVGAVVTIGGCCGCLELPLCGLGRSYHKLFGICNGMTNDR